MRKTLGVVIRTVDFKDSDRMITFLTKEYGLMSAKVRGAKKQTSKLFSASSLFCCGEYTFYEKNGFFGVKSCHIKYGFRYLQNDYDAFAAACFIVDAAGKVAQEDLEAPKLFVLTVNALYALDRDSIDPGGAVCYFIQRLLQIEGLYPVLDHCVICGTQDDLTSFLPHHGGAVCADCVRQDDVLKLDADMIKAMVDMQTILPKDIGDICIEQDVAKRLQVVLVAYLEYALQKQLKSARFIKNDQ